MLGTKPGSYGRTVNTFDQPVSQLSSPCTLVFSSLFFLSFLWFVFQDDLIHSRAQDIVRATCLLTLFLRAMTPSYDCYEWPWLCWKALVRCLGGVSSGFMCIVFFLGVNWDCGTLRTHSPVKYNSVLWHCGMQEARLVHWFFSLYLGQAFAKGSHIQGSREISVTRTIRKPIFTIKRVTTHCSIFLCLRNRVLWGEDGFRAAFPSDLRPYIQISD